MTRAQPAAAALVFSLAASGAVAEGPARLLADFEAEPSGDPSGQAIVRAPSTAVVRLVTDGEGHALEVSGRQAPSGLAGIRVSFRDARGRAAPVDSSGHDYLTFRIRSTGGPSRLQVRIADAVAAARREDVDAGELTRFLPQGVSTEWQQVAIPLGGLGVNRKALAALAVLVTDPSDFRLAIDDVALKREPEDALPPPRRRSGVP